jgi:hypothetical protein
VTGVVFRTRITTPTCLEQPDVAYPMKLGVFMLTAAKRGVIYSILVSASVLSGIPDLRAETVGVPLDDLLSGIQNVLIKVKDAVDADDLPSQESTQELRLELEPPRVEDKAPVAASVAPLVEAIVGAARDVKKAETRDPPLHLVKLEAEIDFEIKKTSSGSFGFDLIPISADVGGKLGQTGVQRITIIFSEERHHER